MQITHLGHAALLLTYPSRDTHTSARILIDPGVFSEPRVATFTDLDAIIITHQHPDHAHPPHVRRLAEANPSARLLVEEQTAALLASDDECAAHVDRFEAVRAGSTARVNELQIRFAGGAHATIHPAIAPVSNVAVVIEAPGEGTFAHTGDSLVAHPEIIGVDALAFPIVAPWSKMQETIDFLRIARPRLALPIHEAVASAQGLRIYMQQAESHAPNDTRVLQWPESGTITV